ncbi:hypothetical protein BGZ82_002337, partial [Podila clonocystis]
NPRQITTDSRQITTDSRQITTDSYPERSQERSHFLTTPDPYTGNPSISCIIMRILTPIATLVALLVSVNAAKPTAKPNYAAMNKTLPDITDVDFFKKMLPQYDPIAAKKFSEYALSIEGTNAVRRNNIKTKAAAAANGEILTPFCVGHAYNPHRTRIFPNRETCDTNGFTTLFVFIASTKYHKHLAPDVNCIGIASNPERTMVFQGVENCSIRGWDHLAKFYDPGCGATHCGDGYSRHESTEIFEAFNPHRIMIYPYYNGLAHGWTHVGYFSYHSRFRPATPAETSKLKKALPSHSDLHKRSEPIRPIPASDPDLESCVMELISLWEVDFIHGGNVPTIRGSSSATFIRRSHSGWGNYARYVNGAVIEGGLTNGNHAVITVRVHGVTYAAATIPRDATFDAANIRIALYQSIDNQIPVAAEVQRYTSGETTMTGALTFLM